jgi:hypothetical protein
VKVRYNAVEGVTGIRVTAADGTPVDLTSQCSEERYEWLFLNFTFTMPGSPRRNQFARTKFCQDFSMLF